MIAGRGVRLLRGALIAGTSIFIAALAHVAGGGTNPGLIGVTLAAAFAVPASAALVGKSLSTPRTAVAVLSSQGLFHLLFSIGASSSASIHVTGGHHAATFEMVPPVGGAAASGMPQMAGMHSGPSMWVMHAFAAAVTLVALRYAERAFWDLVALARTGLAVILHALPSPVLPHVDQPGYRIATVVRLDLRDLGVLLSCTPHRGPPTHA